MLRAIYGQDRRSSYRRRATFQANSRSNLRAAAWRFMRSNNGRRTRFAGSSLLHVNALPRGVGGDFWPQAIQRSGRRCWGRVLLLIHAVRERLAG